MKDWVDELRQNCDPDSLVLVVACNKCDLEEQRVVSRQRTQQFCEKVNAIMLETSAKENIGVDELFKRISEEVYVKRKDDFNKNGNKANIKVNDINNNNKNNKSSCCSK
jgi:GTPase SAR1 family protein